MRAAGRVLRQLAATCPRCEGWELGDVSALAAGVVGACAVCRALRASGGFGLLCDVHGDVCWRVASRWRRCREGRCAFRARRVG